jgi:hypothetical protein
MQHGNGNGEMDLHRGFEDEDLQEAPTKDLVKELYLHGKHLAKIEAQRLKRELKGVGVDGRGAATEARARLGRGLAALKSDLSEQKDRVSSAAKPITAGSVLLHAGVLFLLAALTLGLAQFMALWLATLIVGVVVAGVGALLVRAGAGALKQLGRTGFVRTNREMVEDKRWMSETRDTLKAKVKTAKQALSGVEFRRLRLS